MCVLSCSISGKEDNERIGEILVALLLLKLSKIPSSSISSSMLLLTIALNVIKEGIRVNIRWWMGYAFIVSSHCSIVDLNFVRIFRQGAYWTVIASHFLLLAQWFWSLFILVWKCLNIKKSFWDWYSSWHWLFSVLELVWQVVPQCFMEVSGCYLEIC